MEKILLYIAVGLGVLFLVLIVLAIMGKGEALRKWLGPIGGLFVALVAIFGISKAGSGGGDLAKIRAENDRLEKELARLNQESEQIKAQHEKDRAAFEEKLKTLEVELASKAAETQVLENKLAGMASKTPLDWFNSLPAEDKGKIKSEIDKGINWI